MCDLSGATGTKRRGGPGGLNKLCGITPELQVIVGESALSRTDVRFFFFINLINTHFIRPHNQYIDKTRRFCTVFDVHY